MHQTSGLVTWRLCSCGISISKNGTSFQPLPDGRTWVLYDTWSSNLERLTEDSVRPGILYVPNIKWPVHCEDTSSVHTWEGGEFAPCGSPWRDLCPLPRCCHLPFPSQATILFPIRSTLPLSFPSFFFSSHLFSEEFFSGVAEVFLKCRWVINNRSFTHCTKTW